MKPLWNHRSYAGLALAATFLSGCGGVYDATVTGLVTLDGQAVPRGTVSYSPQGGGPSAYGQIDAQGKYTLRTGREEGLPVGQYTVTVAANEPSNQTHGKNGGPPPVGKSITPDWYRNPANSGLSVSVKSGVQEIPLQLKSTPPPGWKPPRR